MESRPALTAQSQNHCPEPEPLSCPGQQVTGLWSSAAETERQGEGGEMRKRKREERWLDMPTEKEQHAGEFHSPLGCFRGRKHFAT